MTRWVREGRSAARFVGAPERGGKVGTSVCRECETARHRGGLRKVSGHLYWQYRAVWCRTASRRRLPSRAGSSSFALNGKRERRIRASGRKLGWPKRWELPYARSRRGRLAMRCRAPSTAAGSPRFSASASRTWDSEGRPGGVGSDPTLACTWAAARLNRLASWCLSSSSRLSPAQYDLPGTRTHNSQTRHARLHSERRQDRNTARCPSGLAQVC